MTETVTTTEIAIMTETVTATTGIGYRVGPTNKPAVTSTWMVTLLKPHAKREITGAGEIRHLNMQTAVAMWRMTMEGLSAGNCSLAGSPQLGISYLEQSAGPAAAVIPSM